MNLTFDNLEELNQFLNWANIYRAPGAAAPVEPYPTIDTRALDPDATGVPGVDYPALTADRVPQLREDDKPADGTTAEPAKRKRRTKAEIEADAAKAAGGHVDIARVVHADGSVTTTSVGLPPDVDPSDVKTPEGTNPFEQAAAPVDGAPAAASDEPDVVTPFQHLTRGREFIAKHGMPKYLETFTKAGTDPNVMGYSAYQRGLHMAAMDELDKA